MRTPEIVVNRVTKTFADPPTTAIRDLSLTAEAGSVTAVLGVSGSGKSTLLRLVGGLEEPTEGTVVVGGGLPDEARRSKQIGWMAQQSALLPWRTAIENVRLGQTINPHPDRSLPDPANLLDRVGLSDFADAYPGALSGGMRQRVSLARTLAVGARVWLMDEPFASLDELTRGELTADVMSIWAEDGATVIWVTHSISEAVKVSDRIVLLTPRPGSVSATIEIDLPRPRDETTPQFQMLVREARASLVGYRSPRYEATG